MLDNLTSQFRSCVEELSKVKSSQWLQCFIGAETSTFINYESLGIIKNLMMLKRNLKDTDTIS